MQMMISDHRLVTHLCHLTPPPNRQSRPLGCSPYNLPKPVGSRRSRRRWRRSIAGPGPPPDQPLSFISPGPSPSSGPPRTPPPASVPGVRGCYYCRRTLAEPLGRNGDGVRPIRRTEVGPRRQHESQSAFGYRQWQGRPPGRR